jgi:hypothetical protein
MTSPADRERDRREVEQRVSLTDLPIDPGIDGGSAADRSDTPQRPDRWLWIPVG